MNINTSKNINYGKLIGFDVRNLDYANLDNNLKLNIDDHQQKMLCSVDDAIWLSTFDVSKQTTDRITTKDKKIFLNELNQWHGENPYLWDNLYSLRKFCIDFNKILLKPYCFIAISVVLEMGVLDYLREIPAEKTLLSISSVIPDVVNDNWNFLGFDIADSGRLSGLHNCFLDQNNNELKYIYSLINEYSLFNTIEHANIFREAANALSAEHSPFFIYGLFLIESRI